MKTSANTQMAEAEVTKLAPSENQAPLVEEDSRTLEEIITEVKAEAANAKDAQWYATIPKKERLLPGDIVYHEELERFGLLTRPAKKEGLMRVRLFKIGSKVELYTRDWFLDFDDLSLVKRDNTIKRGFAETDEEFVIKASRKSESKGALI